MTEIGPSGCECFRVFAAIEIFPVLDVSRRCRDRSGAANWRQSENEVKHYTCFIFHSRQAIDIYPLYGGRTHFFGSKSRKKSKKVENLKSIFLKSTNFDLIVLKEE